MTETNSTIEQLSIILTNR